MRQSTTRRTLVLLAAAVPILNAEAGEQPLVLSAPIRCEAGRTCFVQNFVDVDPGPEVRDFACGSASYNGHDGVDIRVLSLKAAEAGIAVTAAAPGTVRGVRDEVADILLRDGGEDTFGERDCGNGVVIEHGQGWETQYCHLLKGSVTVKPNQNVERGAKLGFVGSSGRADFAHVHLTVRHNGKPVDPFTGSELNGACLKSPASAIGLWDTEARQMLAYRGGEIIASGFTSAIPDNNQIERDHTMPPPSAGGAQLLFYARLINLQKGDSIRLDVSGPDGFRADNTTPPMDRSKATYLLYTGKKLKAPAWPRGLYRGTAMIIRNGEVVLQKSAEAEIK